MLNEKKQTKKRIHIVLFHLYKIVQKCKLIYSDKGDQWLPGDRGGERNRGNRWERLQIINYCALYYSSMILLNQWFIFGILFNYFSW